MSFFPCLYLSFTGECDFNCFFLGTVNKHVHKNYRIKKNANPIESKSKITGEIVSFLADSIAFFLFSSTFNVYTLIKFLVFWNVLFLSFRLQNFFRWKCYFQTIMSKNTSSGEIFRDYTFREKSISIQITKNTDVQINWSQTDRYLLDLKCEFCTWNHKQKTLDWKETRMLVTSLKIRQQ